jgi:glycosyltransferase involved in cell wall biosynthesis
MPRISVIIPVHNGARFLADAVASVLAQEYPALELIVVDDGSTDDLELAIAGLPVDVKCLHQRRQGPAAARNAGIGVASGDVLAFLDVDDLWPPGTLKKLLDSMAADDTEVVAGWAQLALYDDTTATTTPLEMSEPPFPYYIGAALYRRSVFDSVGLFDPELQYAEDTDWFARLHESGRTLQRLPITTLVVRRHGTNMTRGKNQVELGLVRAVKKSLDRRRANSGLQGLPVNGFSR